MFRKYLESHGIGYFQHQKLAFFFAKESIKSGIMAFIHGLFPNFFETDASDLHKTIIPRYMKMLEKMKKSKINS